VRHLLGRRWEVHAHAEFQHDRLALVLHALVHHWAVAVPLDMLLEALVPAPTHRGPPIVGHTPTAETVEMPEEMICVLRARKVHKRISEVGTLHEVDWHVEEVIAAGKVYVQEIDELVARVVCGDVPHHHRRLRHRAPWHVHGLLLRLRTEGTLGALDLVRGLVLGRRPPHGSGVRPLGHLDLLSVVLLDNLEERLLDNQPQSIAEKALVDKDVLADVARHRKTRKVPPGCLLYCRGHSHDQAP